MRATAAFLVLLCVGVCSRASQPTVDAISATAEAQWRARDYSHAALTFERALHIAQATQNLDQQLKLRSWLDSAYELLGDTHRSIAFTEETLAFYRMHAQQLLAGSPNEEEYLLRFLGDLYAKEGSYAAAIKDLHAARAICQGPKANCGADSGRILRDLGEALYLSGSLASAEHTFREAVQSSHAFYAQLAANPNTAPTSDGELEALRWLERTLVAEHQSGEALDIAQRCRAGALGLALSRRFGNDNSAAVHKPVIDIRAVAREENATLVEYAIAYKSDPVIPLEFSDFEALPAAELYTWVIHPAGAIDFHQTSFDAKGMAVAALVQQVRSAVTSRSTATGKLLQQAYQLLIAPIEQYLPSDPQAPVLFIPQDTLYLLPFAALEDKAGTPLIEKHTIATEVSAQVLQFSYNEFSTLSSRTHAVLALGNPKMPSGFPSLPGAEAEANDVAALFSATAFTGARATKANLVRCAGDARILHFATHGLLNGTEEQLSSLVLAPDGGDKGFLTAREVRALRLHAEMAVLSACDTAEGRLTGDGVLGLARSFLEAGVPSLVVSLWSIPDAATAALMVSFYQSIRHGEDKAHALRTAMLSTRKRYPDARSWAAFTLVGVPDASAVLRDSTGTPRLQSATSGSQVLPIPSGVTNYLQNEDSSFEFETTLSLVDTVAFYRHALRGSGYAEDQALASVASGSFSIVFRHPLKTQMIVIQGSDMGRTRFVSVRSEANHRGT